MSQSRQKQILVPFKVPWMVSPSTSFLRLTASESARNGETKLSFVATFRPRAQLAPKFRTGAAVLVVPSTGMHPNPSNLDGETQLIMLTFDSGIWSKMYPTSDEEEDDEYDSSAVPQLDPRESDSLAEFDRLWGETGLCPDPCVYEVRSSLWLRELNLEDKGWNHYLIEGHDAKVEVLARNCEWRSEGTLEGW